MRISKKAKIFIACPGDVQREREKVAAVVSRLNREVSDALGISLETLSWETNTTPGMGRPQSHISPLVDECDIFVGILWHRFGSPPGTTGDGVAYESGTEEEFEKALARWRRNGGRDHSLPRILIYFSEKPITLNSANLDQAKKVAEFKQRFAPGGSHPGLFSTYKSTKAFEHLLHQHLLNILFELSGGSSRSEVIADFVELPPEVWKDLFKDSAFIHVLCMYGQTWRNTYLNDFRKIVHNGGEIRFLLPLPKEEINPPFSIMAGRIGVTSKTLRERIDETVKELGKLTSSDGNSVQIRFTTTYLNHSLYLFESGGVLGLYSYRPDRSPTPALRFGVGPIHRQALADFAYLWDNSTYE